MFCSNCGSRIDDRAVFCPYCGSRINQGQGVSNQTTNAQMAGWNPYQSRNVNLNVKNKSAVPFVILLSTLALVAVIVLVLVVAGSNSASAKVKKHLQLAQHYLEKLDYEQAIAEYEAIIKIDPKNSEAYMALADIYIEMEDYQKALELLEGAREDLSSQEIENKYDEVNELYLLTKESTASEEGTAVSDVVVEAVEEAVAETESAETPDNIPLEPQVQVNMNPIRATKYAMDGIDLERGQYIYNDQGQLTVWDNALVDIGSTETSYYQYDTKGFLIEEHEYDGDSEYRYLYKNDLEGRKVQADIMEVVWWEEPQYSTCIQTIKYSYEVENGKIVHEDIHTFNKIDYYEEFERIVYKYDQAGRKTQSTNYRVYIYAGNNKNGDYETIEEAIEKLGLVYEYDTYFYYDQYNRLIEETGPDYYILYEYE